MELHEFNQAIAHHAKLAKIYRKKANELHNQQLALFRLTGQYTRGYDMAVYHFCDDLDKEIKYLVRQAEKHSDIADHYREIKNKIFVEV